MVYLVHLSIVEDIRGFEMNRRRSIDGCEPRSTELLNAD